MKYLLDANIFIEANKRYYHDQIVPSFWQWLIDDEEIYTIPKVKEEVKDGNDELHKLIEKVKTIEKVQDIAKVAEYIANNNYYNDEAEKNKFLDAADPLLIACGINEKEITIITNESQVGNDSKKIKIPNVCKELKVKHKIGIFDILKLKQVNLSSYKTNNPPKTNTN